MTTHLWDLTCVNYDQKTLKTFFLNFLITKKGVYLYTRLGPDPQMYSHGLMLDKEQSPPSPPYNAYI